MQRWVAPFGDQLFASSGHALGELGFNRGPVRSGLARDPVYDTVLVAARDFSHQRFPIQPEGGEEPRGSCALAKVEVHAPSGLELLLLPHCPAKIPDHAAVTDCARCRLKQGGTGRGKRRARARLFACYAVANG